MITITGTLAHLLTVHAAGPTADGPWQVHVSMRTGDAAGEGLARSCVNVRPDTPPERLAAIVHEQALALLAHELLEGIVDDAGQPVIDPHPDGALATVPPVGAAMYRSVRAGLEFDEKVLVSVVSPEAREDDVDGREVVWPQCRHERLVDFGIAEIVRRLNHPIFGDEPITTASCDGHGTTEPSVCFAWGETAVFKPTRDWLDAPDRLSFAKSEIARAVSQGADDALTIRELSEVLDEIHLAIGGEGRCENVDTLAERVRRQTIPPLRGPAIGRSGAHG